MAVEAGRNPAIAAIPRARPEEAALFAHLLRAAQANGQADPILDPERAVLVLKVAVEGIALAAIKDAKVDRKGAVETLKIVMERFLRAATGPLPISNKINGALERHGLAEHAYS